VPALEAGFRRFLEENGRSTTAEYLLPWTVQALIDSEAARVRVLGGGGPWGGLTYPDDRPRLVAMLQRLVAGGDYPAELWS
jgi:hypothetical protein